TGLWPSNNWLTNSAGAQHVSKRFRDAIGVTPSPFRQGWRAVGHARFAPAENKRNLPVQTALVKLNAASHWPSNERPIRGFKFITFHCRSPQFRSLVKMEVAGLLRTLCARQLGF